MVEHNRQLSWPPIQENKFQDDVVKAVPVKVECATDTELYTPPESDLSNSFTTLQDSLNILDISSDSDLSIERVYNPQTGKIVETFVTTEKDIHAKENDVPTEIIKCDINDSKTDENHNNININKKCNTLKSVSSHKKIRVPIKSDDSVSPAYSSIKLPDTVTSETTTPIKTSQNNIQVPLHVQKNVEIFKCNIQKAVTTSINETTPIPAVRRLKLEQRSEYNSKNKTVAGVSGNLVDIFNDDINQRHSFSENEIIMDNSSPNISLESLLVSETSRKSRSVDTDLEILDLEGKHLVKHILREMSRSYPNLTQLAKKSETLSQEDVTKTVKCNEELQLPLLPSVQDLKKKFEQTPKVITHKAYQVLFLS